MRSSFVTHTMSSLPALTSARRRWRAGRSVFFPLRPSSLYSSASCHGTVVLCAACFASYSTRWRMRSRCVSRLESYSRTWFMVDTRMYAPTLLLALIGHPLLGLRLWDLSQLPSLRRCAARLRGEERGDR